IVDEQHRFGVLQRAALQRRGAESVDVLVMSATPIPRTLALTLYGDLAVSTLDELPPGRTPITTELCRESRRERVYGRIRGEIAERFGLAQLHQLRGRVGRGRARAHCFLVVPDWTGEEAYQRLRTLEQSTDGFHIAEADLALRGPGDFLGTRQAGLPDFRVANLLRDTALLRAARDEALASLNSLPSS